jgi:hypothetical protein
VPLDCPGFVQAVKAKNFDGRMTAAAGATIRGRSICRIIRLVDASEEPSRSFGDRAMPLA